METGRGTRTRWRQDGDVALPALSVGYFAMVTSSGMFGPVLPTLGTTFGLSTGSAGQLSALAALTWGVLAPLVGPLSDRYGRRLAVAWGLGLMGLGSVLAAVAPNAAVLAASRVVTGLGGASFGPSGYAYVADTYPPARRAQALGVLMTGYSAAALVGLPAVAILASWTGYEIAFAAVGALSVAAAAGTWVGCRAGGGEEQQILGTGEAARGSGESGGRGFGIGSVIRRPANAALLLGNTLHQMTAGAVGTFLAAYLAEAFGLSLREVAPPLAVIAAGAVAGSAIGGRLGRANPLRAVVAACAATAALSPLLLSGSLSLAWTVVVGILNALAQSLRVPAHVSMVSGAAAVQRGSLLGINATSNQTGLTAGAAIGGALLTLGGFRAVGIASGVASAGACACYALVLRWRDRR